MRRGAGDGEALGRELAEHDVQQGDDGERDHEAEADGHAAGETAEERLEQMLEGRLGESAQTDARDRDAELAGGEVGVDVLDGVTRRRGARLALLLEVGDLAEPHARDGELGGHEERVERHEHEGREDAQTRRSRASPGGTRAAVPGPSLRLRVVVHGRPYPLRLRR